MASIEDGKSEAEACQKLLSCLRSMAFKTEGLRSSGIEKSFSKYEALFASLINRSSKASGTSATPKRSVGAGGSIAGRKNVKVNRNDNSP